MRFRQYTDKRCTPPISSTAWVEVIYRGDTGDIVAGRASVIDWSKVEVWRPKIKVAV